MANQFTSQQLTTILNEINNDPESLGFAALLPTKDVDNIAKVLNSIRDGVTPCVVNSVIGPNGSITGATNASPIVIASTAHGRATGDCVYITGVGGNTAANNVPLNPDGIYTNPPNEFWIITVVDANHFSLNGSTGNSAYTSGGTWNWLIARLANLNTIFNQSVPTSQILGQISATDAGSAAALTGTQSLILPALLNPNGSVILTDSTGVETLIASWLTLLTPVGSNSRKAVKALETRFGSRSEQILNLFGSSAGNVLSGIDVNAAINGHY